MAIRYTTDTAGTLPADFSEGAGWMAFDPTAPASGRKNWLQATVASKPTVARVPKGGVRNLANGSASPSGYNNGGTGSGLTFSVVGSGVEGGENYVDIRFAGTASSAQTTAAYLASQSQTDVVPGQTFTGSVTLRRIGGSDANVTGLRIAVREVGGSLPSPLASETTSETDVSQSETLTTTTSNTISAVLQLVMASGAAIDVTYRVKGFQFEEGSTPSAYQANFSAYNITEPGVPSLSCVKLDGEQQFFTCVFPDGLTDATVAYQTNHGTFLETGVDVTAGGTLSTGAETGPGGTLNLIPALARGDAELTVFNIYVFESPDRASDVSFLNAEARKIGQPGVYGAGAELLTNGAFATAFETGWDDTSIGTESVAQSGGAVQLSYVDAVNRAYLTSEISLTEAGVYRLSVDATGTAVTGRAQIIWDGTEQENLQPSSANPVQSRVFYLPPEQTATMRLANSNVGVATFNSVSIKKLTAGA